MGNLQMANQDPRANHRQQKAEPLRTRHCQIKDCQKINKRAADQGHCHGLGDFDRDGQECDVEGRLRPMVRQDGLFDDVVDPI